jgi:hypothetical protein
MYNFKVNDVDIKLDLDKGCAYVLGSRGAIGKTYLYGLLSAYRNFNGDVLVVTYAKNMSSQDILKMIDEFGGDIIMLDRFDLYFDESIVEAGIKKGCIVLIDLKSNSFVNKLPVQPVDFVVQPNSIEVSKW